MSGQADIIKKASLKVKVVRGKTGAVGLQGPKVFKEFWFVFRALVGGDKILEYHQNERKFQESAAYPKGVLHLGNALAVSYHNPEKKQQFSIELAGGSFIFLETNLIRKLKSEQPSSETPPSSDGEVYSEVAPSVPNPGVSEGYGRLNHHQSSLLPPSAPPPSLGEDSAYSRLGATPTLDPYASLSDAHIEDLTEALRNEGEEGGDYNRLGVVPPPGHTPQIDSLGYCKPWTSYTKALNTTSNNNTPQPSLNGIKTGNGNGTATVGGDAEYEALYDKMEDSEATPPPPPPRRGSLSRHSKSPPTPPIRASRSPAPLPPKPIRDSTT